MICFPLICNMTVHFALIGCISYKVEIYNYPNWRADEKSSDARFVNRLTYRQAGKWLGGALLALSIFLTEGKSWIGILDEAKM